ncbi:MAG: amidohydrolase family protein [Candidatus Hydrogenedens sp.]
MQDNLFRKCLRCATEYKLPIKLHTGYFAGYNGMDLSRVRNNLCDLVPLIKDFPDTTFVIMHISYPYQNELIALCKHYRNVYADMCWSWIIDPASATRFLKEFLTTAPAHKIFTFGGDYIPVELVPGHARIARKGIALAIAQLLHEGWLSESDAPTLIQRIMNQNAHETFDLPRVLKAYKV